MSLWQYVPFQFKHTSLSTLQPQSLPSITNKHRTYKSISPQTRMLFGGGLIAWALIAQTLTDQAEPMLGFKASEQDKERLRESLPKIRSVDGVESAGEQG
ncbi:hypothetical protein MBLNU457_6531t1 [Dothideomycetes sp. NU457]